MWRRSTAKNPFAKTGVWQQVNIHPFNMRVDNRI